MDSNFLVLDVGTTGVKGFVFDEALKPLHKSYHRLSKKSPKKGWVEQDPQEILDKSIIALKEAIEETGSPPKSLGITNQRETTILWDKETGEPVYPAIVWEDVRTKSTSKKLDKKHGARVRSLTGLPIDPYFSATKIRWILENVPLAQELLTQGRLLFGTVDTWVIWNLTDKVHVTDQTNASRTLLFNIKEMRFDNELLEIFDVPESILPIAQPSGSNFGMTKESILGLSLPIKAVCGDQQGSMYAAGHTKGDTKVTYGTGTFMMQLIGDQFDLHSKFFTTLSATAGGAMYALENKIDCCGQRVDALLEKKKPLEPIIREISKKVAKDIAKLPIKPERLIVDGGLTQAPALVNIQSEAAGVPVIKQDIHDGTALGVAKLLKSLN